MSTLVAPIRRRSRIKCEHRLVAHGQPVAIDHRQRKSGALQQRAELAHIGERRHAWRDAAFDLALGLREGFAQFGEAVAADQRRQQQTVRLERAADLDQRAGQVVDKLQRQRRDDQIERAIGERQGLFVGGDVQGAFARPGHWRGRNDRRDLAALGKRAAHRVGGRAEIDGTLERAQHHREPLAQFGGDAVDQEGFRPERAGAPLARAQQLAVEDGRV